MSLERHFSDDGGRRIEWGRTAADYAEHRPNYPPEFFRRLAERNIGVPGQRILDLGTGIGFLAHQFAAQGARVAGVDIDARQVEVARRRAESAGLEIDYRAAAAEETGLPDASFDVVTASQCWPYFDQARASREVLRVLRPGGRLVTCHLCWLPFEDDVARRSEELVLKYNPAWTGAGFDGRIERERPGLAAWFAVDDFFVFDAELPFTREGWRGRFRACRGVGASLSPEEVAAFDHEHAELLEATTPPSFTVRHRVDCHILRPRAGC